MNFTLKQLNAFLTVSELSSFTRAAERLRTTQPALSLLVRELEASVGVRLLDRTTRRTELTEAGKEFRVAVMKIMEDLDHAARNMSDLGSRKRGRITIAAPPLIAATLLPQAIADFTQSYPAISIVVVDTRSDLILQKVRSVQVDCGIGTFPPDEEGVAGTDIIKDHLIVFFKSNPKLSARREITWRELEEHPIITLTRDSGLRALIEKGFESAGAILRPSFEVAEIATALGLVKSNLGVAVLPEYAQTFARFQDINTRPLVSPLISRNISLILPFGRSKSPAVDAFIQVLQRRTRSSVADATAPRKKGASKRRR